jgi:hypothetical protein
MTGTMSRSGTASDVLSPRRRLETCNDRLRPVISPTLSTLFAASCWRGRHRRTGPPGLRRLASARPPGRVAGPAACPGCAGVVRRRRPARRPRHRPAASAVRRGPSPVGRAARVGPAAGVRGVDDDRPGAGSRLWFSRFEGTGLNGVMPSRRGRVPRGQAGDGQGHKHDRTAAWVVGGYRVDKAGGVGSLLLGPVSDSVNSIGCRNTSIMEVGDGNHAGASAGGSALPRSDSLARAADGGLA